MANADFNQNTTARPGGFDADSYRRTAAAQPVRRLTPLQKKLSEVEEALPPALATRAAAVVLSAAIMLASFGGMSGMKLRAKYREAERWFSVGVPADDGYALAEQLDERANAAANILTTALHTDGLDETSFEVQQAQQSLQEFETLLEAVREGKSGAGELYLADKKLDGDIRQLYSKMQELAADPFKMGAVQGQFGNFNSAGTIIGQLQYNEAVSRYNKETGGFPAGVLKGLLGIQEVELFA